MYRGADRDNSQFFAFGAGSSPASSAQPASGSSQPQASRTESTPYIGSHRGPNPNANSKQNRSTAQSSSTTGGSRRSTDPDTGSFAAFGSGRSSAPSYDRTHAPTTGGFRAQSPSSGPTPASGSQSSGHSSHEGMFTGSQSYGSSASSSNTSDPRGRHEGPQDSSSGGRRRRADNGDSSQNVTVASLLEQLKKNSEK